MPNNFVQGVYTPKNPEKYIGNHQPIYRSGWEMTMMMFLDNNRHVQKWASEAIQIPYVNPFTGKKHMYYPDFFVVYEDRKGNQRAEVVEIKPKKQSLIESRSASARDRAIVAVNHSKWRAAAAYCQHHGYTFRVINEDQIFHGSRSSAK